MAAGIARGEVVHIDATLIRADVSWESLGIRHADAAMVQGDGDPPSEIEAKAELTKTRAERDGKQNGRHKKVCLTDPDATMATSARNRRLKSASKQHTAIDDVRGVILDVEVTTARRTKVARLSARRTPSPPPRERRSKPSRPTRDTPTARSMVRWSGVGSTR